MKYLLSLFEGRFKLRNFSYVDDSGELHENVNLDEEMVGSNFGCRYGCGIFELIKT